MSLKIAVSPVRFRPSPFLSDSPAQAGAWSEAEYAKEILIGPATATRSTDEALLDRLGIE
jgi:hypothetical protein